MLQEAYEFKIHCIHAVNFKLHIVANGSIMPQISYKISEIIHEIDMQPYNAAIEWHFSNAKLVQTAG